MPLHEVGEDVPGHVGDAQFTVPGLGDDPGDQVLGVLGRGLADAPSVRGLLGAGRAPPGGRPGLAGDRVLAEGEALEGVVGGADGAGFSHYVSEEHGLVVLGVWIDVANYLGLDPLHHLVIIAHDGGQEYHSHGASIFMHGFVV